MKHLKTLIFGFLLLSITPLVKAQYIEKQIFQQHNVDMLRKDIDQLYKDLQKHHFNLYAYIDKQKLGAKLDSLKASFSKPLTASELYFNLLPILSQIGDGHLKFNFLDEKKITQSDVIKYGNTFYSPLKGLKLKYIAHEIYVVDNSTDERRLKKGTKILSINGVTSSNIIDIALHNSFSDGYNNTFKYFFLNKDVNKVWQQFRNRDSLKIIFNNDQKLDSILLIGKQFNLKKNTDTNQHKVEDMSIPFLTYKKLDTLTGYLKVNTFQSVMNQKHVDLFSNELNKNKNLILDLRGNTGGDIFLMCHFLKFFITKPTQAINFPSELIKGVILPSLDTNKRKQLDYVKNFNRLGYQSLVPFANGYKGKLFVLVNGGTFSAASIFANALTLNGRAILIGEETGGGQNLINAGVYFHNELKYTSINYSIGLIPFYAPNPSKIIGKGVIPDIEIKYTLQDYLLEKDLEMEWVMDNIKKNEQKP